MGPNQSNRYNIKEKQNKQQQGSRGSQQELYSRNYHIKEGQEQYTIADIEWSLLFKKLFFSFKKIYVAIKYQFYRLTAGIFDGLSLPWFKIGLAALAIFILTKKDINFSVNMKAPLSGITDGQDENASNVNEFSLAQPISLKNNGKKASSLPAVDDLDEAKVKAYIKRFTKVATAEMDKFGIPASIKMAQGILESMAGEHPAAVQNNNHFGMPLSGQTYDSAWESWRIHSVLIREQYNQLYEAGYSYRKWAKGLKKASYNADKNYDDKLVEVIERYQLYLLDETLN